MASCSRCKQPKDHLHKRYGIVLCDACIKELKGSKLYRPLLEAAER